MLISILEYIFEIFIFISGITSSILILKKDAKYLGNRFMASATGFIGIYGAFIFFYDMIRQVWAIQLFLRIAMISILIGVMLFYFTMEVMVNSSKWFKIWYHWAIYPVLILIFSVYLIFEKNFITINDLNEVDVQISMAPLILLMILLLFFLISTLIRLKFFGINKTEGIVKNKLKMFRNGLLISVLSMGINVASQVTSESTGNILDVIYFATIATSVIVVGLPFYSKKSTQ